MLVLLNILIFVSPLVVWVYRRNMEAPPPLRSSGINCLDIANWGGGDQRVVTFVLSFSSRQGKAERKEYEGIF